MSDAERDGIVLSLPEASRKMIRQLMGAVDLRGIDIVTPPGAKKLYIVSPSDAAYTVMYLDTTDETSCLMGRHGQAMLDDLGFEHTGSFEADGKVYLPQFDVELAALRSPYRRIYGWRIPSQKPRFLPADMMFCKTDWEKFVAVLTEGLKNGNGLSFAYDPERQPWYVPSQGATSHPVYDAAIKTLYVGMTDDPGEKAEIERFCDHADKSAKEVDTGRVILWRLTENLKNGLKEKPESTWTEQECLAKTFWDSHIMSSTYTLRWGSNNRVRFFIEGPRPSKT